MKLFISGVVTVACVAFAFALSVGAAMAAIAAVVQVAAAIGFLNDHKLDVGLAHAFTGWCLGLTAIGCAITATAIPASINFRRTQALARKVLLGQQLVGFCLLALSGLCYALGAVAIKILLVVHPRQEWSWFLMSVGLNLLAVLHAVSANILAYLFGHTRRSRD